MLFKMTRAAMGGNLKNPLYYLRFTLIHTTIGPLNVYKKISSVSNKSKLETATFRAKTRQKPPQFFSLKTATILTLTATILEIFKYSFYKTM